jgi:hypothetical protein
MTAVPKGELIHYFYGHGKKKKTTEVLLSPSPGAPKKNGKTAPFLFDKMKQSCQSVK